MSIDAVALLADLRGRGLELEARGDQLHIRAPEFIYTPEIRAQVREHRDALWAIAAAEAIVRARPDTWRDPDPDVCATCGAQAIGYDPVALKACASHLEAGRRW